MAKFSMGEMPASPEGDELEMEGMDFEADEAPEEPKNDMSAQLADMSDEELDKLEADIAAERESRAESGEEAPAEGGDEAPMEEIYA